MAPAPSFDDQGDVAPRDAMLQCKRRAGDVSPGVASANSKDVFGGQLCGVGLLPTSNELGMLSGEMEFSPQVLRGVGSSFPCHIPHVFEVGS